MILLSSLIREGSIRADGERIKVKKRYYHKPWYIWLVRFSLLAILSTLLWVAAMGSPFVFVYLLGLHGVLEKVSALAALTASLVVVIGFICYLIDRI